MAKTAKKSKKRKPRRWAAWGYVSPSGELAAVHSSKQPAQTLRMWHGVGRAVKVHVTEAL